LSRQQSENKLQGQLHVEWLTRTDTRRAIVVADGVGALTKSAEEVAAGRRASQRKVFSTSFERSSFSTATPDFASLANVIDWRYPYRHSTQLFVIRVSLRTLGQ